MKRLFVLAACLVIAGACAVQKKIAVVQRDGIKLGLSLTKETDSLPDVGLPEVHRDTLKVRDDEGREILVMKAVRDEGTGEMVASDVLDAAVVTARFRNVAERHGKVDLSFQVTVPQAMQDSRWQIRMYPDMFILGDSVRLEPVVITGYEYRKSQLRGYQLYERFLSRIVDDPSAFVDIRQLEIFLKRNIPEIYKFKNDTSFVSDGEFMSCFGVTRDDALEHYTDHIAKYFNERRMSMKGRKFDKLVKVPVVTEGLRLDTVIRNASGDFVYEYVQTVVTRPELRKAEISLSGEIFEQDRRIYSIPVSDCLTFYISSVSSLVDPSEKYLTTVLERRAEANTACYVSFRSGDSEIDTGLDNNRSEIGRIKGNLASLMQDEVYDMDSIVVASFASPEGKEQSNLRLSVQRSKSLAAYLSAYMGEFQDSLELERGFEIDIEGNVVRKSRPEIPFSVSPKGENWDLLDFLVGRDTLMEQSWKDNYFEIRSSGRSKDDAESVLANQPYYTYLRQSLYPKLRIVTLNFYLHRKGMVKDTVHTTRLDSTYMSGVQAIRNRDYKLAVSLLRPYADINTAIAYTALDYNLSALSILESLPGSPAVNYLMAIIYSRLSEDRKAVECYLKACRAEPSFVHRGNLDPEISSLKKKYIMDGIEAGIEE